MRTSRVGASYYGWLLLAVPLTFLVHEAAHWGLGEALGYDMRMTLNGGSPGPGGFASTRDAFLVSAAGPLITVIQAAIAYWLVRARAWVPAYAFLFVAWFMRFVAAMVSVMHPNDEARMSQMLGWGTWTLPLIVVAGLLALVWSAHRKLQLGWRANVASYLLCSVAIAAVVFLDR